MDPYVVLMIVGGVAVLIGAGLFTIDFVGKRKRKQSLAEVIRTTIPAAVLKAEKGWLEAETASTLYLFKAIPFHPNHELIITNKQYWCINADLKNWRRSSVPNLVPGVAEFLAFVPVTAKPVVRVAVVMPTCRNITRYLNESDVEIVRPDKSAYGVYFLTFPGLTRFLSDHERK